MADEPGHRDRVPAHPLRPASPAQGARGVQQAFDEVCADAVRARVAVLRVAVVRRLPDMVHLRCKAADPSPPLPFTAG